MFDNTLDKFWLDMDEYEEKMLDLDSKDNTLMYYVFLILVQNFRPLLLLPLLVNI